MRYYSVRRPIGVGGYPKRWNNPAIAICNFDSKTFCEDLGKEAWGYIDYEHPLAPEDVMAYELLLPPQKGKSSKYLGADGQGRDIVQDRSGRFWRAQKPGTSS